MIEAGLNEQEILVLLHSFGVTGYENLSTEELAERLAIERSLVQEQMLQAMAKVKQSSAARVVLAQYLQPE